MIGTKMLRSAIALSATLLIFGPVLVPAAGTASSTEISGLHLVYEKPQKMKRADTVIFMPLLDQSLMSDTPESSRALQCVVVATGRKGELPVRGSISLRLLGTIRGSGSSWESDALTAEAVDGEVTFGAEIINALVDEAGADRAAVDLFRIDFDGKRGKKLVKITIDCVLEEASP